MTRWWRTATWQDRLYPTRDDRDPLPRFWREMDAAVTPESRVLDLGAGAGGRSRHDFKGRCREVVGIDVDERVVDNPLLDRGLVAHACDMPFEDGSFDVAFSVSVLEHVDEPERLAAEISRVLAPGGRLFALTPNRWHYVAVAAALTPTSFHRWFNAKRGRPRADTFPTHYRLNDRTALTRWGRGAGLELVWLQGVEVQPNYLTFSLPTFLLGAAYERLVNATEALAPLRVCLIAEWRKPA